MILVASMPAQRPSHAPERVPADVKIRIDGKIDEAFWLKTVPIRQFTQVEPVEGAAPSVETTARIAFDRDHLYIAVECSDDPTLIRHRLMRRDANLDPDDRVEFWIDTFDDQRTGYWFQIGAGGSKGDALISDGGQRFNKSWDGIWRGVTRVGATGWTAEIALPFKTIAFREGQQRWGFNLRRLRKANEEELRWASPQVAYRFFDLTVGGVLVGLSGIDQGAGLDVVPYAKVTSNRARGGDHTTNGDWGGDVRYRLTPSLAVQLTYNTDFAETEVDQRQVNLTRFPLFFPEKRDFFLEDAALFEFGAPARRRDTVAYFSRTIGRGEAGDPVPILAGARVAGRAGEWNIGALEVVLDAHDDIPERGVGVARVSRNFGEGNSVGVIYTGGRPNERGYSSTFGADFALSDPRAFGDGRSARLWGYAIGTEGDGPGGEGVAYGLQGEYRSSSWQHEVTAHHVDDEFVPELGFVQRQGIRRYRWDARYTWRLGDSGSVRQVDWRLSPTLTTTDENELDSWSVPWRWFELEFNSQDSIEIETHRIFERIDEQFELRDVPILPGDYLQTRHFVSAQTSEARSIYGSANLEFGDFYDGELLRWGLRVSALPSSFFQLSARYDEYDVKLQNGSFVTRVTEGRADFTPTPYVSFRNLVQYDTESQDMALQSRLRWIFEPGRELFLVGLFGWERPESPGGSFVPTGNELALKVYYTLRF